MIGYNVTRIDSKVSAMITQAELGRRPGMHARGIPLV